MIDKKLTFPKIIAITLALLYLAYGVHESYLVLSNTFWIGDIGASFQILLLALPWTLLFYILPTDLPTIVVRLISWFFMLLNTGIIYFIVYRVVSFLLNRLTLNKTKNSEYDR